MRTKKAADSLYLRESENVMRVSELVGTKMMPFDIREMLDEAKIWFRMKKRKIELLRNLSRERVPSK